MPPGIACTSTPASTGSTARELAGWRVALSALKWALTLARRARSSPVSKPSLSRIATIDSHGGWLENELIVEIAVSRQPAPASAAARYIAAAMPLVTPTSQIVGVQSVLNVLSGKRYAMVTDETRRYAAGYYGRTPAPIEKKLQKKLMGDLKPITCRPADLLKPGLAAAAKEIPPKFIQAEEDILSYCLFPEVALGYFKWRAQPADAKDPIPADVEMQKAEAAATEAAAPDAETVRFARIGKAFAALLATCGGGALDAAALAAPAPVEEKPAPVAEAKPAAEPEGTPVVAPLNGTFYRSAGPGKPELAADGAAVKAGEPCCIVEAMKLFNPIKTTAAGKITFVVKHGDAVQKGQTLAVIR